MTSFLVALVGALSMATTGNDDARGPQGKYAGNCTDAGCHAEYTKRAVVHEPAGAGSCDACHEEKNPGSHDFSMASAEPDLCLDCHDEEDFEGEVVHRPLADGKCTVCHDPHGSPNKSLVKMPVEELCLSCHKEIAEGKNFLHGPVAVGACIVCHDAHASDHPALLTAANRELCLTCHTALATKLTTSAHKHAPVLEACDSCHDPHGANNRFNLHSAPTELCLDCHDDIAEIMDEAEVQHGALSTKRSCLSCHDPHASNPEHLLTQQPMELCLSCHNQELKSGEDTLGNIDGMLSSNPSHHGPIQEKDCSACHQPHGGDHFRLLVEDYPKKFYAPFDLKSYSLCFSCHEADMVRDAQTDKLTNFRNGDQNLHYLHVNRKVKGRSCRSCHATHASSHPKHITDSVPFGQWQLPVGFRKTATGGSCSPGCHRPYRYDRDKPVVNGVQPTDADLDP